MAGSERAEEEENKETQLSLINIGPSSTVHLTPMGAAVADEVPLLLRFGGGEGGMDWLATGHVVQYARAILGHPILLGQRVIMFYLLSCAVDPFTILPVC